MIDAMGRSGPTVVSCIDRDRRIVRVSRTISRRLADVLGRKVDEFVAEDTRAETVARIEAAFAAGAPDRYETRVVLADGSHRWFENEVIPFVSGGGDDFAVLITNDVTAGRSSEERYRGLAEHLPDYVVILDRDRRFHWVNRLAPGLAMDQVIGHRMDEFVAPEQLPIAIETIETVFETGQPGSYEIEAYAGDGERAWYQTRVFPAASEHGEPRVLALTSDVTERKRAELALRDSEARFRALAEHSPDFIAVVDQDRRMLYLNKHPPELRIEDVIGQPLEAFTRPEYHQACREAINSVLHTGEPAQYDAMAPDDDALYTVRAGPFPGENGQPRVLTHTTDVTRARREQEARDSLRAQLEQAQRMESVGLLAGGIAHDFNNLLQVMTASLHFAKMQAEEGENPREDLDAAIEAAERAAELTNQLLAFGRRQAMHTRVVDLGELVGRVAKMMKRTIPASITVAYEPPGRGFMVEVDAPQIEQVLLNLCLNARDAMSGGGRLELSVAAGDKGSIVATVRDTGHGIESKHRDRIFEPFFTTKPSGVGSGLGLAVADGIVQRHHGVIDVRSQVDQGTEFTVRLPAAEVEDQPRTARVVEVAPRGAETVLVAEDEPKVLELVVRVLEQAGYRVLQAGDGLEAVEAFAHNDGGVDLVVLDAVMPRLNGWQAYQKMLAARPNVRVLFTSGYSASALPGDIAQTSALGLVQKPYEPATLLNAVRRALDSPVEAAPPSRAG